MQQVPLCLWSSDLEMNWTSSLLFQSDELAIVPHLSLWGQQSTNLFVVQICFLRRSNAFNKILLRHPSHEIFKSHSWSTAVAPGIHSSPSSTVVSFVFTSPSVEQHPDAAWQRHPSKAVNMWRGLRVEDPSSHGRHNPEGWPITGPPPSPWTNGRQRCPIAPCPPLYHTPASAVHVGKLATVFFSCCNVWSRGLSIVTKVIVRWPILSSVLHQFQCCWNSCCSVFPFRFQFLFSHCYLGVVLNFPHWFALFDFSGVLRQWRRGNIALITTLPVLDCLISVQHLQSRCLEDRFPPSAKSLQHIISHLHAVLRPPCILHLLTQEIHRQMRPQDLSSQVPSSRKLPLSTPELLCATSPRKNFKTWCSQSSSEQKRSLLGLCVILDESIRHPPDSRGSAEGFLDVSNLCRPGTEEKGEEVVLRVPCIAWDIAQEMEWRFCEKHNLNLSHAWACNIMCDVRMDCAHLYRLKCGVWEVYLFTWTYDLQKASCAPKKTQNLKNMVFDSFCETSF